LKQTIIFFKDQDIGQEVFGIIRVNPLQNSFRCYIGKNHYNAPTTLMNQGNLLAWDYYDSNMYSHWAYPFSVDGTIYDKKVLLNVISPVLYHMPTTLEANIVSNVRSKKFSVKDIARFAAAWLGLCLTGLPI